MRAWPVRSALYIDFENLPLPPEAIANWLAWLEDGVFDASGRRRRFLQKRVYWNSHAERHRDLFERHGFASILIGKFSGLKNGADIRMAMDVIEATYTRFEIDEYILLTGDSDFVPVLDRLREKSKRSAIVATEHRPNIHTTYHLHADVLISARRLATEAPQYRRPPPGFLASLLMRRPRAIPLPRPLPAASKAPAAPKSAATSLPQLSKLTPKMPAGSTSASQPHPAIESALVRVVDLLSRQPRNYMAQKRVLAELDQVPGFRRQGTDSYLGLGGYRALMRELAKRDDRITVVSQPGGGTGVVFMPPPEVPVSGVKPAAGVAGSAPAARATSGTPAPLALRSEPETVVATTAARHDAPASRASVPMLDARET